MEKTIDKFADEQEMLDAYINGEYTAKEIVSVFLPDDVKEQYNIYCSEKNLQDTEETAAAFLGCLVKFPLRDLCRTFELRIIQICIETASCKEFLMISLLNDIPVLHNKDQICITDR